MRNLIIGVVFGVVTGTVLGATVIGPQLVEKIPGFAEPSTTDTSAQEVVVQNEAEKSQPSNQAVISQHIVNTGSLRHWRMASSYSSTLPELGALAKRLEQNIERISEGQFRIEFHEPGALVRPDQVFDAVRSGTIEAAFTSPANWGHKIPALRLFSSVPFGLGPRAYLAWFYFSGGQDIYRDIYHKQGIHGILCGMTTSEASGWFKKEVKTPGDLNGLRMRISGLGAKVMSKLGVQPEVLTDGDVIIALKSGLLDAAEFYQPTTDLQLGIHKMADYYYFPGWHQPITIFELMVNLDTWDALSDTQKLQLTTVCGDDLRYSLGQGEATQFDALKKFITLGVNIQTWPDEVLDKLREAWAAVITEESQGNRDFKRVWNSLQKFREEYGIWRELSDP